MARPLGIKPGPGEAYPLLRRRYQLFVDHYIQCGSRSEAMKRSGYQGSAPREMAYRIMQLPEVQQAIAERAEEAIAEAGVTNHRILTEVARIAFADVTRLMDPKTGALLPIAQWPEAERAAVEATEVEETTAKDGTVKGRAKKVRMHDKLRALELLARYKKLLVEQHEFPNGIPAAPPVINIGFANGGPGTALIKRDSGAESS